jgi:hypothetical protein
MPRWFNKNIPVKRFGRAKKYGVGFHLFDQWKAQQYQVWTWTPFAVDFTYYAGQKLTLRGKLFGFCIEVFILLECSDMPF